MTGPTVREWRALLLLLMLFALGCMGSAALVARLPHSPLRDFAVAFEVLLAGFLMGGSFTIYLCARLADDEIRDNLKRAARLAALQEPQQDFGGFRRHE